MFINEHATPWKTTCNAHKQSTTGAWLIESSGVTSGADCCTMHYHIQSQCHSLLNTQC